MLKKAPEERATLAEILSDPWITINGKEILQPDQVEFHRDEKFGNLKRIKS